MSVRFAVMYMCDKDVYLLKNKEQLLTVNIPMGLNCAPTLSSKCIRGTFIGCASLFIRFI